MKKIAGCAPPVSLIGSAIRHLRMCNGLGTLLVPLWESSYFWPLLIHPNGGQFADFIEETMIVNPCYVSYGDNDTFNGFAQFKTIALKLRF